MTTNNNSGSVTLYSISASYLAGGLRVTCSTPEVLGDAYGRLFASEVAAEVAASDLQNSLGSSGLPDSVEYRVYERTAPAEWVRLITELSRQDRSGETDDSFARTRDARDTIARWYTSAAQGGDADLVAALDEMGHAVAARLYAEARSR